MTGERGRPQKLATPSAAALPAEAVTAYLRDHPDFLLKHPELLELLTPPAQHGGSNVLDMGQFMVRHLQEEVGRLRRQQRELLEIIRGAQGAA